MHFDGLIRKFTKLPSLLGNEAFNRLSELLSAIAKVDSRAYRFADDPLFNECAVYSLMTLPPGMIKRSLPNTVPTELREAINDTVEQILPLFNEEHRVQYCQMFWLNPGDTVGSHCDTKSMFKRCKRFNVVIKAGPAKYNLKKGRRERVEYCPQNGDVFELNNRSEHGVYNSGHETMILLILDFIETTARPISLEESRIDDHSDTRHTEKSPTVIFDY